VAARNIYGYGPFSSITTIKASFVPDTCDIVTTISVLQNVLISWTEPPNGGDLITKYQLLIYIHATSSFVEDLSYCDGSDATNFLNMNCVIPHAVLIATYGLQVG
jgi:hypothetical protein